MSPMKRILMPLPNQGFDPSEAGVSWRILTDSGLEVVFSTPDGRVAEADPIMVTGKGLGPLAGSMSADRNGRAGYEAMTRAPGYAKPLRFEELRVDEFAGLVLPGGHAKEMRPYLESATLQRHVAAFVAAGKPVGAICHGVLVLARAGALKGRRVTCLPAWMELLAFNLTRLWLGDYYRTYPATTQAEVTAAAGAFEVGPRSLKRDAPGKLDAGFVVRDGALLTARWPGDAHRFATELAALVKG